MAILGSHTSGYPFSQGAERELIGIVAMQYLNQLYLMLGTHSIEP